MFIVWVFKEELKVLWLRINFTKSQKSIKEWAEIRIISVIKIKKEISE